MNPKVLSVTIEHDGEIYSVPQNKAKELKEILEKEDKKSLNSEKKKFDKKNTDQ